MPIRQASTVGSPVVSQLNSPSVPSGSLSSLSAACYLKLSGVHKLAGSRLNSWSVEGGLCGQKGVVCVCGATKERIISVDIIILLFRWNISTVCAHSLSVSLGHTQVDIFSQYLFQPSVLDYSFISDDTAAGDFC